jgi:hypothetical protein
MSFADREPPPARGAGERQPDRSILLPARTGDGVVEAAGTGSAAATGVEDQTATFDARWLREREGYRDGGY